MKTYQAIIHEKEFSIKIDGPDSISIDGTELECSFTRLRDNIFLMSYHNCFYEVYIPKFGLNANGNDMVSIFINGQRYGVQLEDERRRLVKKFGFIKSKENTHSILHAPMPGLITKIFVHQDEEVKEGQRLILLEAMKMENELRAQRKGIVKSILIHERETVEKNAALIELA